jgi:hypothetical protein
LKNAHIEGEFNYMIIFKIIYYIICEP